MEEEKPKNTSPSTTKTKSSLNSEIQAELTILNAKIDILNVNFELLIETLKAMTGADNQIHPDEKMAHYREVMRYILMTPEFQKVFGIRINPVRLDSDEDENPEEIKKEEEGGEEGSPA